MMVELSVKDFDHIFDLMKLSFPTDEYRTYEEQKLLFSEPSYKVYGLFDENNKTNKKVLKYFICCWNIGDILYIEHFAVNPAYRNSGIGTDIIRKISSITENNGSSCICLEVEPPDNEDAERRIQFYKRNGYFLNQYDYVQPPLSKGKDPVRLMIMTFGKELKPLEFQHLKEVLYRKVYKCHV